MAKGLKCFYPGNYSSLAGILEQIGINPTQLKYLGSGFSTMVFDTTHGQVLKLRNKDVTENEWPGAFLPDSKYVLQPICVYDNFAGFIEVSLFPKLNIQANKVTSLHSKALKYNLGIEGLDFSDDKKENVGLSDSGVPYVIDSDAIFRLERELNLEKPNILHVLQWPESQWSIFPCEVLGASKVFNPDETQWEFAESYGHSKEKVGEYIEI